MEAIQNKTVTNAAGKEIDYDAAVLLMDDDLRAELANSREWETEQEFFDAYETAHAAKYGAVWELSKPNPTW